MTEIERPERVQAAFEVWHNRHDTGPNASALFEYIERLESAIRAEQARPSVKPLEWVGGECRSSLGDLYNVARLSESVFTTYKNGTAFPGWMTTLDAAKAAAQADYSQRILSALAPSTTTVERRQAIEDALRNFTDGRNISYVEALDVARRVLGDRS